MLFAAAVDFGRRKAFPDGLLEQPARFLEEKAAEWNQKHLDCPSWQGTEVEMQSSETPGCR